MATPSRFRSPTRADPRGDSPLTALSPGRRWGRGIVDRYGFGLASFTEPPANPNLGSSTFNAQNPADQGAFGATALPGNPDLPALPANPNVQPVERPENPTLTAATPAVASATPDWMKDRLAVAGLPASRNSATGPDDEAVQAEAKWMARGGSQRMLHKAQVAAGLRPRIDGRTTQAPQNSTASDDIRAQWGWETDSTKLPY